MHVPYIPGIYFFMLLGIVFLVQIIRNNMSLADTISAFNSVGSQPTALIVLSIGCYMLIMCKEHGLDPTVAGGIIGVSSNMLTNQFVKQHNETNSDGATRTVTETGSPSTPANPTNEEGHP